jgi:hypothetical protein
MLDSPHCGQAQGMPLSAMGLSAVKSPQLGQSNSYMGMMNYSGFAQFRGTGFIREGVGTFTTVFPDESGPTLQFHRVVSKKLITGSYKS